MKKFTRFVVTLAMYIVSIFFILEIRDFAKSIYVEGAFGNIRFGPFITEADVDRELSWFTKAETSKAFIPPYLLVGNPEVEAAAGTESAKFVSYYINCYGFVVVFDSEGKKIAQLKSDTS